MVYVDRKQLIIVAVLLSAILFGVGYKTATVKAKSSVSKGVTVSSVTSADKKKNSTVTVHVTGAVKKPGVYILAEGSRIVEAVYRAQPAKEADLSGINMAEVMRDQQQVILPWNEEISRLEEKRKGLGQSTRKVTGATGATRATGVSGGFSDGRVSINSGNTGELDSLPGIGVTLAQRIVDYRNQHGGFKDIMELRKVSGIGEKKFAKLKDQVRL